VFTTGDCFGGSLRWDIFLSSAPGVIHVYYGDPNNTAPSFQSCSGAYTQTGKNLMSQVDLTLPAVRFEIGNTGVYTTWATNDATPTGGVNETESIQPKDTGQFYLHVDCKYIYNLDP